MSSILIKELINDSSILYTDIYNNTNIHGNLNNLTNRSVKDESILNFNKYNNNNNNNSNH